MYTCDKCQASFKHKKNLIRHEQNHSEKKFTCTICNVSFQRPDVLKRHTANRHEQNKSDKKFTCEKCPKVFKYKRGLVRHEKTHNEQKFACPICQVTFTLEHNLKRHIEKQHPETRKRKVEEEEKEAEVAEKCHKKKQKRKAKNKVDGIIDESDICPIEIQNDDDDDDEPGLVNVQRQNWAAIKTHSRHGKSQKFVNVRWTQDTAPNFSEILRPVFEKAETRFKIQVSNGFVLRKTTDDDDNDDDESFRYFHACENNAALLTNRKSLTMTTILKNL